MDGAGSNGVDELKCKFYMVLLEDIQVRNTVLT